LRSAGLILIADSVTNADMANVLIETHARQITNAPTAIFVITVVAEWLSVAEALTIAKLGNVVQMAAASLTPMLSAVRPQKIAKLMSAARRVIVSKIC